MPTRPQSNIKFIHCRHKDTNGGIKPHGGLTIAYVLDDKFKVIGYAPARCHDKDHYNKHIGRAKASGRLRSAQYFQECAPTDEKEFIQKCVNGYKESTL